MKTRGPLLLMALLAMAITAALPAWVWSDQAATTVKPTALETKPEAWELEPASSWTFEAASEDEPAQMLITQVGKAKTKPVRRPFTTAVLKDTKLNEAKFKLKIKSLEPVKKKGRDVCIILGYIDDTHYTYVHVSNDADGRAHNIIMKVEGDKRRTIQTPKKPEPRLTQQGWQTIEVRYDKAGNIAVFQDDWDTPLMTAKDPDIVGHRVGVGSFNDRAAFTAIALEGK